MQDLWDPHEQTEHPSPDRPASSATSPPSDPDPPRPASRHTPRRKLPRLPKLPEVTFGKCLELGHFSHVYEGTFRGRPAAIKAIERGSGGTIEKEVILLARLRGLPHIVQLWQVILEPNTFMIFELAKGLSMGRFYAEVTIPRFRLVLRCLLEGLRAAHSVGVVHRDVKLENLLVSRDWRRVKLIDWGCGAAISDDLLPNAGSRAIRSLEMLIGYRGYRTAGDLWAVGCLIFGVLCHGEVPWRAATASDALVELARYVGAGIIVELAGKYDKELPTETVKAMHKVRPKRFANDFSFRMRRMSDPELIDLMIKLLAVNIEDRLTVDQALQHPFFAQE